MRDLVQTRKMKDARDYLHLTSKDLLGIVFKYDNSVSKALCALVPEYKQMCTEFVMKLMNDFHVNRVEDILHIPFSVIQSRDSLLLEHHDNSISKCKHVYSWCNTIQYYQTVFLM